MVAAATSSSGRRRAEAAATQPVDRTGIISVVAGESVMSSSELLCMTPLLRFLQLLCENHNIHLQVCECVCVGVYVCGVCVWGECLHTVVHIFVHTVYACK